MSQEVVIVGGARTPMREYVGDFKDVSALELGGHAARGALQRSGVEAGWVDHVVMGNAMQTSGDALYGARHVALKAGCPVETPALTVNRLCGSGIQSLVSAAQMIRLGESRLALAGGMENMSQAPHVIRGARSGFGLGHTPLLVAGFNVLSLALLLIGVLGLITLWHGYLRSAPIRSPVCSSARPSQSWGLPSLALEP